MRLFVAIDIEEPIRQRIARFMEGVRGFAPDARWVRSESLHLTLKFIGEKPPEAMEEIKSVLSSIQMGAMELSFRGYGFFPTAKAPRVFWVGVESGPELSALAKAVDTALNTLHVPKEAHAYSPHLTLARGGAGSGAPGWRKGDRMNKDFQHLMEKLVALPAPEFGAMTARKFFLYESQLLRGGARYTKMAEFLLQ
jgi:2'-5' RNA ligase